MAGQKIIVCVLTIKDNAERDLIMIRKVFTALVFVSISAAPSFAELPAMCQFVTSSFDSTPWYSPPCPPDTTCDYHYGKVTYDQKCNIIGIDEGKGPVDLVNGPVAVGGSLGAPPLENWSLTNVSCPEGVKLMPSATSPQPESSEKLICRNPQ